MEPVNGVSPSGFYQDTTQLKMMKGAEALHASANEFEAMFLQLVLKNMREASYALTDDDSLFSSKQTQFYQAMMDGQTAQHLATHTHLGLAEAIQRQMAPLADIDDAPIATELKKESPGVAHSEPSVGESAAISLRQPLTVLIGGKHP